jgi:hypothetical protein
VSEKTILNFQVKGEAQSGGTPALFSNFLAVSQVGTEVQFEFVFLDLNLLAGMIAQQKAAGGTGVPVIEGKTAARVVMPAAVFAQMKEHFDNIFNALAQEGIFPKAALEDKKDERHSTRSSESR